MRSKTIVLAITFSQDGIAIDYARTADIRDNASTGSAVVLTHRLEVERSNRQYRDEIEEIEDKTLDLIADIMEDFDVAEPIDLSQNGD